MAICNSIVLLLFFFATSVSLSTHDPRSSKPLSLSFPLTSVPLSSHSSPKFLASLSQSQAKRAPINQQPSYNYRSTFKYSMALIVSLPIGTPPQTQQMVLDTGSQLSWIQCKEKVKPPPTKSFDPSLSSSFSVLPCNHPICKPRVPDFTLPTSCDQNRLCHYSYFYADGTLAEGNLVREKFTFSSTQSTPPLILGCATDSSDAEGILGMNIGRLSFASQAKISKFSYCTPLRPNRKMNPPMGGFYLGQNPTSQTFQYVNLLTFPESQRMPNFDPLAFTLPMVGLWLGTRKLNVSTSVFRPNAGGAGQTIIDSGSEFTYLVDEAYSKVRDEIVKLVGPKLKKGFVYEGALDMCFDGDALAIGRSIGDLVFEFDKGVEIAVEKERVLADVGGGVHCLGIGRSDLLGIASNIIGNVHQQNYWVEYDLTNRRVGFGKADCSRSVL
ncbi:Aspartic proteinase [Actinidia chinensis var. chinensis]|uniref:Aspartic proteinase n=1 Tax=Actinidia chinensis var. chinensis TaxID=1590841 RepID=A0A2R6RJ48_ACTCC|nr:Aspartic proteinase [Actinidia chinensis var. chinensis]